MASGAAGASDVLVVGGGLAGMACALRLSERGVRVTVLETRKKLGGRATSFKDVRSEQWLDNCQHVVLGCCTNYLHLLGMLGVRDRIRFGSEQFWVEEGGRVSVVRRGVLPAPAHFSVSMLGAAFMSLGEKVMVARACARIMRVDRTRHAHETFASFLSATGQSERIVRRFWSPVVVSACNLDVDRVSAAAAIHVFQEGFLAAREAADIGVPTVPLLDLYERAPELIERAGGTVRLGTGVERVGEREVVTTGGERLEAERVVLAVPVERVRRLVDPELALRDGRLARLDEFTHSPILGVHLAFDRPVMGDMPHAVLVDRPTQWLFRKSDDGTRVHAVISAADAWVELDEAEIGRRVVGDMAACLPAFQSGDAPKLVSVRAVKEKLATFAPVPGLEKIRPATTGSTRLILAGDYTDTGWPATMEGATRSGFAAAAAVLDEKPGSAVLPPLAVAPLARLMGLRSA